MEGIVICVMMVILLLRKVRINCSRALEVKLQPVTLDFNALPDIDLIPGNSKALQK